MPQSTVSVGAVLSIPTVSVRQSEALPAMSSTRVSSVCVPSAVIETAGGGDDGAAVELVLDPLHAGAGVASVPVTVVV